MEKKVISMFKKYFSFLLLPLCLFAQFESISFNKFFLENKNVMLLIDPNNGEIIKANKSAQEFYQINIRKLERLNIKEINTFTKVQVQNEMQKAKSEKRNYFIFNHKLANGKTQKVRVFSSPINYKDKKLLHSTIYPLVLEKEYKDYYNKTLEEQVNIQAKHIKESQEEITLYLALAIVFLVLLIIILYYFLHTKNLLTNKLELESKKLSSIINNIPDLLWIKDTDGVYIACNNRFEDFFGAKEKDIVGKTDYDFVEKELADFFREHDNNAMNSSKPLSNYEEITFACDNHKEFLHTTKTKVIDNNGNILGILGIGKDITKEKKIQAHIKKQKDEFETIFKSVREGIAILDLNAKILNCNDAFIKLTGYTKEQLIKKSFYELTSKEDKKTDEDAIKFVLEHEYLENLENNFVKDDGKIINVNISISLLLDKKRLLLTIKDMTTIKMLEQNERLASMGEMIGNIAHQWRQPLSVITASASGMKLMREISDKDCNDDFMDNAMDSIINQSEYLSKTIDNFRDFVKGDISYSKTSIKQTIEQTLDLINASLKMSYISIYTDLKDDITINGSVQELEQAFLNILNNSKDILKEKVSNEEDRVILVSTKKLDKNKLELSIKDSGGGVDYQIIEKIFEPYFTTKHKSQGTGLGLSMVDKIIRDRHKGLIAVENKTFKYKNKEYKGLEFKIVFHNN